MAYPLQHGAQLDQRKHVLTVVPNRDAEPTGLRPGSGLRSSAERSKVHGKVHPNAEISTWIGPASRWPLAVEQIARRSIQSQPQAFGLAPDGRLFRSENGTPLQPSTWWQVWQKVHAKSLTPRQVASPLMKRPYDLRHSGVTWRLNSGVPATEVAAWAGHSVEMLMRVYARCVVGLEGVWIGRMDDALRLGEDR
jgi:hypothetical protein